MEAEDMISLPASSNSGGSEDGELRYSDSRPNESDSQPNNYETKEGMTDMNLGLNEGGSITEECATGREINIGNSVTEECAANGDLALNVDDAVTEECAMGDNLAQNGGDTGIEDGPFPEQTEVDMDLVDSPVQVNIEVADSVTVIESLNSLSSSLNTDKGCLDTRNEGTVNKKRMMDGNSVSGVKRARMTYDEQHPSVLVMYNSLTRASKRKLEELLQQWSEWHAQHGPSQELNEMPESGEETYFPALQVGMEKSSAVSFCIENETRKQHYNGFIALDNDPVPLYDRGYALGLTSVDSPKNVEGGLGMVEDAARCFNCGSYSHSLKGCPKPRDNVAINNARKQHKSKRNQNACNPTRYYQNSSGGKYDGLKPGVPSAETRQLLGFGELDPPPWFNRMRELGYPPGYLDPDDEDQPSGITIFGDGDAVVEEEDGEIIGTGCPEPQRKMTIEFPGINAPIPENADERLWADRSSSFSSSRNHPHSRLDHSSEPTGRWQIHRQRWSRDFTDDGPPGVDTVLSPSGSSYPPSYGSFGSLSLQSPIPTLSRSYSDRGWNTSAYEDFVGHSPYSSSPYSSMNSYHSSPYSFSNNHYSAHDNWRSQI